MVFSTEARDTQDPHKKVKQITLIHEGMEVFDSKGDRIGRVNFVYLGAAPEIAETHGTAPATTEFVPDRTETFVDDFAKALVGEDDMPKTIRNRLLRDGYIRIDAPLLKRDRYALSEQIEVVSGDKVHLNVPDQKLIKRDW